jgi:gp16 family phage-associated protein
MTVQSFKARLRRQGKTIRQWAEENGFPTDAVYRALSGVHKGHFGRSHDILVAAGLKPGCDDRRAA